MATAMLKLGDPCPPFNLPATDGKTYSLADFGGKILVAAFSCNHCPYVKAMEDRMNAFARDYAAKGVEFVAINSNETSLHPEDTFDNMVIRAQDAGFAFPYLRDEDQGVAKLFDAACTPEFFVFDSARRLRYHGRFDDNTKEPEKVTRRELIEAVEELLAGKGVANPETQAIGCSIKWAVEA